MRKAVIVLLAAAFIIGLPLGTARADDGTLSDLLFARNRLTMDSVDSKESKTPSDRLVHAKRSAWVKLTGMVEMNIVNKSRHFNEAITGTRKQYTKWDPKVELGLEFFLGKDVYGWLKLQLRDDINDDFGTQEPRYLSVKEAYANIKSLFPDVFGEEIFKLKVGVQEIVYDLRGNGHAFMFDTSQSESAFWPGKSPGYAPATAADKPFDGLWNTRDDANDNLEFSGFGEASTTDFGGFFFSYDNKKKSGVVFDFIFGITRETREANEDQSLAIASLTYHYPKEMGKLRTFISGFSNNPASRVFSYGIGLQMFPFGNSFEMFFEMVGQGGVFLNDWDNSFYQPNGVTDTIGERVEQLAFGGYWGFRYTYTRYWHPYVEASYWYLSGDPDQTDDRQQCFLSYEDVDETLIIEDNLYGLDVDTNYQAIKLKTGFNPIRHMTLEILYAYFARARDRTAKDKIAQEIDIRLKWDYTESCTFEFGGGRAFDMDYLGYDSDEIMAELFFKVGLKF